MVIIFKVHHYHHCIVHCGQPGLQRRSLQVLLGQSSPCLPAVHSGAERDDDGDDDDDVAYELHILEINLVLCCAF